VTDGVDLVDLKPATADVDEHGGGRLHALIGEEEPILRLYNHHAGGADAVQLRDRAGEFTLHGAQVVGPLHEIGEAKLAFVENLEAHAIAAGQSLAREIHADLVHHVARHLDGGAAGGDLMRNILGLQLADDRCGILLTHARVEQLVVGSLGPEHDARHTAEHGHGCNDQRHALVETELFPEIQEGLGEIFHLGAKRKTDVGSSMFDV
jgi:hypothetical protein